MAESFGPLHIHVKLLNSLNDGNAINKHQCQVIIQDPEKTQDPARIRTQDLLITSQTLLPLWSHIIQSVSIIQYVSLGLWM